MSKIENALAKARGQVVRLGSVGVAPGTDMVVSERRLAVSYEAERAVATRALARMEEPWLLDASGLAQRGIVAPGAADPEAVAAFRELRTKILQTAQTGCTIMVTSLGRDSDAAFVAAGLAVSFALDDSKTALLVDCCLEAPMFGHLTPSTEVPGITDYLKSGNISLHQIIHPVGVRRLRVIPTGRGHDRVAEYFTSAKMRNLLDELRRRYVDRYIFIGAPSISESADASIIMELADYVLLVVPYGTATEAEISEASKLIGDKKLLGAVFSGMPVLPARRRTLSGWIASMFGVRTKRGDVKVRTR